MQRSTIMEQACFDCLLGVARKVRRKNISFNRFYTRDGKVV